MCFNMTKNLEKCFRFWTKQALYFRQPARAVRSAVTTASKAMHAAENQNHETTTTRGFAGQAFVLSVCSGWTAGAGGGGAPPAESHKPVRSENDTPCPHARIIVFAPQSNLLLGLALAPSTHRSAARLDRLPSTAARAIHASSAVDRASAPDVSARRPRLFCCRPPQG